MRKHIKGIIIGMTISLALVMTACSATHEVEAQQDNELKIRKDVKTSNGNFTSYIMTDKKTGIEYIVIDRYNGGATITPRIQKISEVH